MGQGARTQESTRLPCLTYLLPLAMLMHLPVGGCEHVWSRVQEQQSGPNAFTRHVAMSTYQVEITELQYVDPRVNSDKFYRTYVVGGDLVTQYGRNGSFGTFGRKAYASAGVARSAADRLVANKLAKGYDRVSSGIAEFDHAPSDSELDRAASSLPAGVMSHVTMPTTAKPSPAVETVNAAPATNPTAFNRVIDALSAILPERTVSVTPSGPTRPMLAETVATDDLEALLDDDEWVCQPKLDGDRVVIEVVDGVVSALNRAGQPKVKNVGEAHLAPFRNLTAGRWVFDGEMVGRTLWLFDMPAAGDFFDEGCVPTAGFDERHAALVAVIGQPGQITSAIGVVGVVGGAAAKRALLDEAQAGGKEGIMFRNWSGPYEPGRRSVGLLKHKFVKEADCVVRSLDPAKQSVSLGVYNDVGELVEVGAASTIGKGEVTEGDVVEVRFLYVMSATHPRMYQPRIVRVRTDKAPSECSIRQFANAVTDKTVEPVA